MSYSVNRMGMRKRGRGRRGYGPLGPAFERRLNAGLMQGFAAMGKPLSGPRFGRSNRRSNTYQAAARAAKRDARRAAMRTRATGGAVRHLGPGRTCLLYTSPRPRA